MKQTRQHIADELDFQVKRTFYAISNIVPNGGDGIGMLKFEELADVCKRASDALRGIPDEGQTSVPMPADAMGWHCGTTGE